MPNSVYIHIPFCKTHCPYCDFAVWLTRDQSLIQNYVSKLCDEISDRAQGEAINTLYLGGGTPSLLPINLIEQLIYCLRKSFRIAENCEITLETNPGTVDQNKLQEIKKLGINRLSIGVQTFDENLINKLARGHNVQDAIEVLNYAKKAGFQNISLDLIYGLPGQSMESWEATVDTALQQSIQHISCYSLSIEEGTPFKQIYGNSSHKLLPQETQLVSMYEILQNKLLSKGFKQYEVSNFSQPGFESKHNQVYWQSKEFYGFGVSAHEFINGKRKAHNRSLEDYLDNPLKQETLESHPEVEELMLPLRTVTGLNLNQYKSKFGRHLYQQNKNFIDKCIQENLLSIENNYLKLTNKGFLLSTEIISRLI